MTNASATIEKTATKAATKAATKKAPTKVAGKGASKAPTKKASGKASPTKVATRVTLSHAIGQSCRPAAGAKLAAYSAAWMNLTGFDKGATLPRAMVAKIAGERAIAYHVGAGNMARTEKGLTLTAKGKSVFSSRAIDPEMQAAYEAVLKTGKPSDAVGAKAAHIIAIAA